MAAGQWVVYLVRCSDNSLYCGVTNDLDSRLSAHNSGKGAKYTKSRLPVELVCASRKMSKSEAFRLEFKIKRTPVHKKQIALEMGL
ncbi:MAG: GIY-YIG nuclease family protein [Desulfobacteraceae bacterium]|jgi:putative endonuclease